VPLPNSTISSLSGNYHDAPSGQDGANPMGGTNMPGWFIRSMKGPLDYCRWRTHSTLEGRHAKERANLAVDLRGWPPSISARRLVMDSIRADSSAPSHSSAFSGAFFWT
jgi:hypothetical protein